MTLLRLPKLSHRGRLSTIAALALLGVVLRRPTPVLFVPANQAAAGSHRIGTTNPEAQRAFDRGLQLVYAFDYDEAIAAFERAAVLDPTASMPHWGIALALGPSINDPRMEGRMADAHRAISRAMALSESSPARDRDYVLALSRRYAPPPVNLRTLSVAYADAMRTLVARYPDDVDAATLFAESLMLSGRGELWQPSGAPGDGVQEAMQVLESVLARAPRHLGANHHYIHLLDHSPMPERALAAAERLEAGDEPSGHLLHMPSHIFVRLGDFRRAVRSNLKAVAADRGHQGHAGPVGGYASLKDHAREFLSAAAAVTGQSALARQTLTNTFVLLRFNRWDEVLQVAEPSHPVARLEWAFARVVAETALGRIGAAEAERVRYEAIERALPATALWWSDPVKAVLPLALYEMSARLAWARGDRAGALALWQQAVAAQDRLTPGEIPPWPWFHSTRESLGAVFFKLGRFTDAESVFREDLRRFRGNPRSLYGLSQALQRLGKPEAAELDRQFREAWADADVGLTMDDL